MRGPNGAGTAAFVVAIGLDKNENGQLITTFQIANPEVGTSLLGTTTQEEQASEIVSIAANDIFSVKNMANAFVSRQIVFSHLRIIIVSEELARSEDFPSLMYSLVRERELRRSINLMVTKERAETFIKKNKPILETRPHKYYQLMIQRATQNGLVPKSDLLHYYRVTEANESLFLAMYASLDQRPPQTGSIDEDAHYAGDIAARGDVSAQLTGAAVFRKGRMIGTMTGEETRLSLLLNETAPPMNLIVTMKDPLRSGFRIPIKVTDTSKPRLTMDLHGDPPTIRAELKMDLEIVTIPSMIDYSGDLEKQKLLRESLEAEIESLMAAMIEKTQKEFKGEPFEWGLTARRHFLTDAGFRAYGWMERYPEMKIECKVHVNLTKFGLQLRTPNIRKLEE